jgi:hypothetical protein
MMYLFQLSLLSHYFINWYYAFYILLFFHTTNAVEMLASVLLGQDDAHTFDFYFIILCHHLSLWMSLMYSNGNNNNNNNNNNNSNNISFIIAYNQHSYALYPELSIYWALLMYFAMNLFQLSEYSVTVLFASDLILVILHTIAYFYHHCVYDIEGLMQRLERRSASMFIQNCTRVARYTVHWQERTLLS